MLQVSKSDFIHIFNDFIHVYSPGARAYNPLGILLMSTESPYHFAHSLQVSKKKKKTDFIHIFNNFIYVYSPVARADNPLGTNFWCQQKSLIILLQMFSCVCIAPGQEQTTPWWQSFNINRKPRSLWTICCKFQNDLFEFWFYTHFLYIMYMYIASRQGQTNPWGQNFDVNRKLLPLRPLIESFKRISLNSDFLHIFFMFFHMYIALGQGQTTLCGQNSDVNRKTLSHCPFVASFKKISLKSDFIHIYARFLYMYIAPGQGQTTPWDQNFYFTINLFVILVICCKFLSLNDS